jgi:Tfp pilus assembly protein PilO|tara:strand:- start:175 stop:465 length:291 start_codon:yes stop_codon:yes gene_type:complete
MSELESMKKQLAQMSTLVHAMARQHPQAREMQWDVVEDIIENLLGRSHYRLRNGLIELGVWSEDDIRNLSKRSVLRIPWVGKHTVAQLFAALEAKA